ALRPGGSVQMRWRKGDNKTTGHETTDRSVGSPVQKAQEEICSLLVRQIISSEPYESQQARKRLTPRADRQHGRGSRGFSLRSAPRVFCHARLARPSRIACCWVAARSRIPV